MKRSATFAFSVRFSTRPFPHSPSTSAQRCTTTTRGSLRTSGWPPLRFDRVIVRAAGVSCARAAKSRRPRVSRPGDATRAVKSRVLTRFGGARLKRVDRHGIYRRDIFGATVPLKTGALWTASKTRPGRTFDTGDERSESFGAVLYSDALTLAVKILRDIFVFIFLQTRGGGVVFFFFGYSPDVTRYVLRARASRRVRSVRAQRPTHAVRENDDGKKTCLGIKKNAHCRARR